MYHIFKKSMNTDLVSTFLTISTLLLTLFTATSCGGGTSNTPKSTSSTNVIHHQGVAQKGPMKKGALVTITPLDLLGVPSQPPIQTTINDLTGAFEFDEPAQWKEQTNTPLYEILSRGMFFDESLGQLFNQSLQLRSFTTDLNLSSVNLLTHWIAARTKILLQQGKTPAQSILQSKQELRNVFGIKNASRLNIAQSNTLSNDNAMLMLFSGALMDVARQQSVNPQKIIEDIALDFSDDGKLTELGRNWSKRIQARVMRTPTALTNRYSTHLRSLTNTDRAAKGSDLPNLIPFASRPSAILPSELNAKPNETLFLDASETTNSNNLRFTWFRIDQQAFDIPFNNTDSTDNNEGKFIAKPSITLPDQEVDLLFAVTVTDSNNLSDTAVTKVIVKTPTQTNTAPSATAQTVTTPEDNSLDITLAGTDPDGDTITSYIIANTPIVLNYGSLDINGALPNLKYTPSANAFGTDSFTFKVSDGDKTSSPATVTINITAVNDKPIATPQVKNINEDTTASILLSGTDIESDPLSFSIVTSPTKGTLSGTPPNIIYTPDNNYFGTDSFTFNASDSNKTSTPATVDINITAVNDPPIATPQTINIIDEDNTASLSLTGFDVESDPLSFSIVTSPTKGTLSGTLPNIIYTPNGNYFGTDSFTFKAYDGTDYSSVNPPATVAINISSVSDGAPTASFFVALLSTPNTEIDTTEQLLQGISLRLDASASDDPDDYNFTLPSNSHYEDIVSYSWEIANDDAATVTFTGSTINNYTPAFIGPLKIKLTVTDSAGLTSVLQKDFYVTYDEDGGPIDLQ